MRATADRERAAAGFDLQLVNPVSPEEIAAALADLSLDREAEDPGRE